VFVPYRPALLAVAVCWCILAQQEAAHPQSALWTNIKRELTGPNGEEYFQTQLRGAELPMLRGKVLATSSTGETRFLMLDLSGAGTAEIKLLLASGQNAASEGAEVEFMGECTDFTRSPFLLTMRAQEIRTAAP
jgi:hypothetical protein